MSLSASDGFRIFPQRLTPGAQAALVAEIQALLVRSPLYRPVTPGGRPMSVEMTNLGALGWCTDASGYRYQDRHPVTGDPWPDIPRILLDLWTDLGDPVTGPDACLVNVYGPDARMGLHQDKDEADFRFPVVSVSLGDTAMFRIGGQKRSDPTRSLRLASGDVCVLDGQARLAFHGVDRILTGSSRVWPGGGRLNLTLRRARPA
ncbi:MAG: alkylated DNA repair dioxygenase [Alphaproteobacteria bacterium PA2]|nr:MAG: alkylated DNA repair dioxygenase [Alphaproteobacteria bacterium PA2]